MKLVGVVTAFVVAITAWVVFVQLLARMIGG